MCTSKVRYPTYRRAVRAALRYARIGPNRIYRCPVCRGWHLTVSRAFDLPSGTVTHGSETVPMDNAMQDQRDLALGFIEVFLFALGAGILATRPRVRALQAQLAAERQRVAQLEQLQSDRVMALIAEPVGDDKP